MTQPDGTLRVFIALSIPSAAKSVLGKVVQDLMAQVSNGVRWVGLDGMHLTLKFLGNIDSVQVGDIVEAMRQASQNTTPFPMLLSGLGMFPNEKRPRVIWAGLQGDLDSMGKLQARIEDEVSRLGFSREKRPFSPHLTLGRVREKTGSDLRQRISAAVLACSIRSAESWQVESVRLVQSQLTPGGAAYTDLASVSLISPEGPQQ